VRASNATVVAPVANAGGYLGIGLLEVDKARAKEFQLPEAGVTVTLVVTLVSPGSPADVAGLRSGDAITEFEGQKVEGLVQFQRLVRETPPGRTVRLRIQRNGALQVLSARMGSSAAADRPGPVTGGAAMPAQPDVPRNMTTWGNPVLGIEAEPLMGQLAGYFGVSEGVLVRSVVAGSAAEKAGLRAGDVVTRVGKIAVTAPAEVTARLREVRGSSVRLTVMRERGEIGVTVSTECMLVTCGR
jgi:serine protease Do